MTIKHQKEEIAKKDELIASLEEQVATLKTRVEELEALVDSNTALSNSGRPPHLKTEVQPMLLRSLPIRRGLSMQIHCGVGASASQYGQY